jgi:hypothetical protein
MIEGERRAWPPHLRRTRRRCKAVQGNIKGDLPWNDSFPRVHFAATSMVIACFAN